MEVAAISFSRPVLIESVRNSNYFPRTKPFLCGIGYRQAKTYNSLVKLHFLKYGHFYKAKDCSWLSRAGVHGCGKVDGGGGGRGGDGGGDRFKSYTAHAVPRVGDSDAAITTDDDVIFLNVEGMSCGGCVASVKSILEGLPQVASATVNLDTERAAVWTVPEARTTKDWQQDLGEILANHLTNCGFKSSVRGY